MNEHTGDIEAGRRFEFGRNWRLFLRVLNKQRIDEAKRSLQDMLEVTDLKDKRFLDIGSGSGLFSLAASQLGANVHSMDYDPEAVACTMEVKDRYCEVSTDWSIEEASVLNTEYLKALGHYDIVYSWGVLHHTGAMWEALDKAQIPVAPGGKLFISIYNKQRLWTPVWAVVKRTYNRLPRFLRVPFVLCVMTPFEVRSLLYALITKQMRRYIRSWTGRGHVRGMSRWYDWIDWVGGYPFETAKPEEIVEFYKQRGFILTKLVTCGGYASVNEYVFVKLVSASGEVADALR